MAFISFRRDLHSVLVCHYITDTGIAQVYLLVKNFLILDVASSLCLSQKKYKIISHPRKNTGVWHDLCSIMKITASRNAVGLWAALPRDWETRKVHTMISTVSRTALSIHSAAMRFLQEDDGASLVEYVLLIALIAVVCLGAVTLLGTNTNTKLVALLLVVVNCSVTFLIFYDG